MCEVVIPLEVQPHPDVVAFRETGDGVFRPVLSKAGCAMPNAQVFSAAIREVDAPYKPGDVIREREEWMLSAFVDVGAAYGGACSEEEIHSLKYVLQYRDEDGDWFTARTIWPRDKDYVEARKLVTCYADECRERPAEEMPAWVIRPRVVESVDLALRNGVWSWVCQVRQVPAGVGE